MGTLLALLGSLLTYSKNMWRKVKRLQVVAVQIELPSQNTMDGHRFIFCHLSAKYFGRDEAHKIARYISPYQYVLIETIPCLNGTSERCITIRFDLPHVADGEQLEHMAMQLGWHIQKKYELKHIIINPTEGHTKRRAS